VDIDIALTSIAVVSIQAIQPEDAAKDQILLSSG